MFRGENDTAVTIFYSHTHTLLQSHILVKIFNSKVVDGREEAGEVEGGTVF